MLKPETLRWNKLFQILSPSENMMIERQAYRKLISLKINRLTDVCDSRIAFRREDPYEVFHPTLHT